MDTILKLPQPTGNIGVDSDISRVGWGNFRIVSIVISK
jgi:hypothetical protein